MWDNAKAMGLLIKGLTGVFVLLLIGIGASWLYAPQRLPVKQIVISGKLKHTDGKVLQDIAGQYLQGNILRVDVDSADQAVRALPWTDSVQVVRRLPDAVEIRLTERTALARWKNGGLLDTKGNVFQADSAEKLPLFDGQSGTGGDMVKHYQEFNTILKPMGIGIKELIYTSRSAWLLVLDNGITVRLGREHEVKRLQQFAKVWPALLAKHRSRIEYVDMRYKDGFAVRYSQTAMPSENGSGKNKH
ncbi:cell division protein FtsQ/DivIB [Neisseria sp. ZJ106]|uniref:Cell division protein FtsQ n=1 Tax=Neisseria lisongii TaxID=2912188 RepID=A0ABY7RLB6_9NEIS|nr:cell division protein FtsQ/DivIB [Neisseria lisongii]MCF7521510.1 cell division protein FtsQ/DivIB [Neisseria lisongii]WCL71060.1 cell division protein FtsQ/DivIB [Neisseria lisongii]